MEDKRNLNDEEFEMVIGGAAKVVAADDASNTKVTEDKPVVVIKNGKKFTLA